MKHRVLFLVTLLLFIVTPDVSADRPSDWPKLPPHLKDLVCDYYDEGQKECEKESKITEGFKWIHPDGTLHFKGVEAVLEKGKMCQIYIKARSVLLVHTSLLGCDIIIEANLIFKLESSVLSVDGSQIGGKGYAPDKGVGISYGGAGGYCQSGEVPDVTYGDYNTPYYDDANAKGSGGHEKNLGGGRIVILTEQFISIESNISADGYPKGCGDQRNVNGGSGGYVYISANSTFSGDKPNSVSAKGGAGCGKTGLGGSGGRIIFPADPAEVKFFLSNSGGPNPYAPASCSFGAAGTTLCNNCTKSFDSKLIINQEGNGLARTIPAPTFLNLASGAGLTIIGESGSTIIAKALKGQGNIANVQIKNLYLNDRTSFQFYRDSQSTNGCNLNFNLSGSALLNKAEIRSDCNITLNITNAGGLNLTRESFISSGAVNSTIYIKSDWLGIEDYSGIVFTKTTPLKLLQAESGVDVFFKKSLYQEKFSLDPVNRLQIQEESISSSFIVIQTNYFSLQSGSLQAAGIFTYAQTLINNGNVLSTSVSCNSATLKERTSIINPMNYELEWERFSKELEIKNITKLEEKLFTDYSIILVGQKSFEMNNLVQGSRIGLFSANLTITSTAVVSAAGLGCPSNMGDGAGFSDKMVGKGCAPTGGAHASIGGIGLNMESIQNTSQCLAGIQASQKLYGDVKNPLYEGSGGGSYQKFPGGAGGGFIILGSLDEFEMNGIVNASGSSPYKTDSKDPKEANHAGAGSGGSIQLFIRQMFGNGSISANGGCIRSGSFGGVGSGGKIKVHRLNWTEVEYYPFSVTVPTLSFDSGIRYGETHLAAWDRYSNGSLHTNSCPPGYYGPFCRPCTEDSYKNNFGSGSCQKCSVPDRGSLSPDIAKDSFLCKFSCKYEVWIRGSPICASNIFFYSLYRDSKYYGVLVFIYFLVLIATSLKSLKCKKSKKKSKQEPAYITVNLDQPQDSTLYFNSSHVQRIHLLGDNTPESKWFINSDIFNLREVEEIRDKIDYLIKIINRATQWKKLWVFVLKTFILLYPPLYFFFLKRFRQKISKKIDNFVKEINQDLAEYCVLRNLSVYYIVVKFDSQASYGYLDLFHDDGEHSIRNTLLPVSYVLSGNGNYTSPYFIDKKDSMIEHLIKVWVPKNSGLSEKERKFFQHDFETFARKINKRLKYLDFFGPSPTFQHYLQETITEINKIKDKFANDYAIFLNFTSFEVPRFTVEEADLTQPFLLNPIRVTVLEDVENQEFKELATRLQKVKNEEEYDVKLYLIVQTGRDLQDLLPKAGGDANLDGKTKPKKKKNNLAKRSQNVNLDELKESFFNKLDQISFNVEYSLPKFMDVSPSTRQKNASNQIAEKSEYVTSRRYFIIFQKVFSALFGYKPITEGFVELYVQLGMLVLAQTVFLWMRNVALFELGQTSSSLLFLMPFPLAPLLAPLFGILGLLKRNAKFTLYFGILNACSMVNHILSLAILAASETSWSVSLKEPLNFLIYILSQERVKRLLAIQNQH